MQEEIMKNILYARLVDKEEAKRIKKLRTIGIPSSSELVPAFEATDVLGILGELKNDKIKLLHKLMGGKGNATYIILFKPEKPPVAAGIPFRNSGQIQKLLGHAIKESKFSSNTIIEIILVTDRNKV